MDSRNQEGRTKEGRVVPHYSRMCQRRRFSCAGFDNRLLAFRRCLSEDNFPDTLFHKEVLVETAFHFNIRAVNASGHSHHERKGHERDSE